MRNSRYWMGQTDWFIDDAGSREATGADAGHPIPEIERQFRMGRYPDWNASAYHLRYLTDTNNVFLTGQRSNAHVFVHGSATNGVGQSTLYSGNMDSVTALNRTTTSPAGGQPILITSNALPTSWTASGLVPGSGNSTRMRRTSDGATGWVMKDLGSRQCRSSEWTVPGTFTAPFAAPSAAATPAGGDAFVVERLTKINTFRVALTGRDLPSYFNAIVFDSVDVGDNCINGGTCPVVFVGCRMRSTSQFDASLGALTLSSCRFTAVTAGSTLAILPRSQATVFNGCLVDADGVAGAVAQITAFGQSSFGRTMAQGIAVILLSTPPANDRGGWSLGQLGVFDVLGRTALTLESQGSFFFSTAAGVLWGSGNDNYSIGHRAQASWYSKVGLALGTNLNMSSTLGDISFSAIRTACPAYDDSIGIYTPNRTLSFPNILATVANGGFCKSAGVPQIVDPLTGCAIGTALQ